MAVRAELGWMDALALLRLQIEWGADEALSDEPIDRLAPISMAPVSAAPVSPAARLAQPASQPTATVMRTVLPAIPHSPAVGPSTAAPLASQATSLATLRDVVASFDGCSLRDTASNLVFAEGDPAGRLLLIGEPPGADEDRAGHPFAGAEGALLDAMLASIGLERSAMVVAHLIPWRPPGGRPPNPGELAVCLPFLTRMIELAAPAHIVLLGTLTARTLMPKRKRGEVWGELSGPWGAVPALALPSLGALRKDPLRRREAWAGLRQLRRALDAGVER